MEHGCSSAPKWLAIRYDPWSYLQRMERRNSQALIPTAPQPNQPPAQKPGMLAKTLIHAALFPFWKVSKEYRTMKTTPRTNHTSAAFRYAGAVVFWAPAATRLTVGLTWPCWLCLVPNRPVTVPRCPCGQRDDLILRPTIQAWDLSEQKAHSKRTK